MYVCRFFHIQHGSLHTYIYTYIHTYIHTYTHTYIHTYGLLDIRVCTQPELTIPISAPCMHVSIRTSLRVFMDLSMYVCMYNMCIPYFLLAYTSTFAHVCTQYSYMYVCIFMHFVFANRGVCTYLYIYIYIYIYIYTHTHKQ